MDKYPSIAYYKKHKYSHSTSNISIPQAKNGDSLDFLMSEEGQQIYATVEQLEGNPVKIQKQYKDKVDPSHLAFCITQYYLRKKGLEKWTYAEQMIFTERGLQQATSERISAYKSERVKKNDQVLIGCAGIGGEVIEIARTGAEITAVELDPELLNVAEHNVSTVTSSQSHTTYRAEELIHYLSKTDTLWDIAFVDPDRRIDNKRKINIESYSPAFSELAPLLREKTKKFFVKVAPALEYTELWNAGYSIECIQEEGTVKELLIGYGVPHTRKATLITENAVFIYETETPVVIPLSEGTTDFSYLYEPAGCILRAGLVGNIAEESELCGLHPDNSLLYSNKPLPEEKKAFFTEFEIITILPFHIKNIRHFLREQGYEKCIIKKRFFPMEPHEIRKHLKIKEGGDTILYFTTGLGDRRICIVCKRISQRSER